MADSVDNVLGTADTSAATETKAEETPSVDTTPNADLPTQDVNVSGEKVVDIKNIQSIKVRVQAILGGVSMSVAELADVKQNDLIPLDTSIGDEVDLWANGVLIGRGEIVVIEAETPRFGITLTKLVNAEASEAAE